MAAPTYNNSGLFSDTVSGTSISGTATVNAGSNRVLYAWYMAPGGGASTSATYNGVAMTAVGAHIGENYMDIWVLANPAGGANTLTVNHPSTTNRTVSWFVVDGGHQTTPTDVFGFGTNVGSDNPNKTITTTQANTLLLQVNYRGNGRTTTPGVDETEVFDQDAPVGIKSTQGTYKTAVSSGSNSVSETLTSSSGWDIGVVAVAPVGGGDGGTNLLSLIGVG